MKIKFFLLLAFDILPTPSQVHKSFRTMFSGAPSPAQIELAKINARGTFLGVIYVIGGIRVVPFAWQFIRSLF